MSLTTEIQRLRTNINNVRQDTSDILEAIANKGVTVPAGSNLDDCAGLVSQISSGSGFDIGQSLDGKLMPDGRIWATANLIFAPWPNGASPYDGVNSYLLNYGIYMNWDAMQFLVTNRATFCPGWNVPTKAEIQALFTACNSNFNTLNAAGFNIQLGGGKRPDNWDGRAQYACIWSRTSSSIGGWHGLIQSGLLDVGEAWASSLINVRLIKDQT